LKVLIIGLGSIARKHIGVLKLLVPDCELYALRSNSSRPNLDEVISCFSLYEVPVDINFIIISNPTALHLETIKKVIHFGVPIFIEKPPIDSLDQVEELLSLINSSGVQTYTAFNLRFNPIIKWLKENIRDYRVIEVNAYCGSYLPSWRPNQDYKTVYSAREELGGGVHLDLTHEIDYLIYIFGRPNKFKSIRRKISDLEINSIDSAKYWMEYTFFTTNLVLNYFRRDSKRVIEIVTDTITLECDLLKNQITELVSNEIIYKPDPISSDHTYLMQMIYFLECLKLGLKPMNDLAESIKTMEVCLKQD
jgi:predicted dehydrogenase